MRGTNEGSSKCVTVVKAAHDQLRMAFCELTPMPLLSGTDRERGLLSGLAPLGSAVIATADPITITHQQMTRCRPFRSCRIWQAQEHNAPFGLSDERTQYVGSAENAPRRGGSAEDGRSRPILRQHPVTSSPEHCRPERASRRLQRRKTSALRWYRSATIVFESYVITVEMYCS